ncbi:hypothetical protein HY450_00070 [Candidatus Pacearchaeota archaeon]|nr:hypothetical protein [Candidatus Pacearchaeota archaeon]
MRGVLVGVILALIFALFNMGIASGVPPPSTCSGGDSQFIFSISSNENAHVAEDTTYPLHICFDDYFAPAFAPGNEEPNNIVLRLSDVTNAHVEGPAENTPSYSDLNFGDLTCRLTASACSSDEALIVSLADNTNSHVSLGATYPFKLCCSSANSLPIGSSECGDGEIDVGEDCDPSADPIFRDYGDGIDQCSNYGPFDGGDLVCNPQTCEIDTSQCTGGGTGDFCADYDPFIYTDNDCNDPAGCIVDSCNDYTKMDPNHQGYDGDIRMQACEFDCVGAAQTDPSLPNGATNPSCEWDSQSQNCELSYYLGGNIQCVVEYLDEGVCNPTDTSRIIIINSVEIDTREPGACGGEETKSVLCPKVIQLDFFNYFNFIFSALVITLVYIFLKKR